MKAPIVKPFIYIFISPQMVEIKKYEKKTKINKNKNLTNQ